MCVQNIVFDLRGYFEIPVFEISGVDCSETDRSEESADLD